MGQDQVVLSSEVILLEELHKGFPSNTNISLKVVLDGFNE